MDWTSVYGQMLSTVIYAVIGFLLLGLGLILMEKLTPFSIRKEIEEDHNVALGIIIGAGMISIALVVSAVVR